MNRIPLALAFAAVLITPASAGCLEDLQANGGTGASEAEFALHGAFTANRTEADFDDFHALVDAHDAEAVIMESFPEQFAVDHVNATACASLRDALDGRAYVRNLGACTLVTDAGADDAHDPVGHAPSNDAAATDADWRVSGAFTESATDDDVSELRADVEALGGDVDVMESHPLQYAVTVLDERRCEDVRELLATRAYVDSIGDCREIGPAEDPDGPEGAHD